MILRVKNIKMIIILFMLTVWFGCQAVASEERIYIEEGKVGDIAIGMNISSLMKKYPAGFNKTFIQSEGDQEPAYIYRFNNGKSIILEVNEEKGRKDTNVIWLISVDDPYFKTNKGIGVGNTFTEVKKAYPNAAFSATQEESIGLNENGLWFSFDISQVKREWWLQKEKDISALNNIKVNVITIFQRPK
ncbi:MAG TPA: hypothetical protein VL197_04005 [Nitrospirota bacterium]|nr:hypothetical protein [Nitrospirota bacterium]